MESGEGLRAAASRLIEVLNKFEKRPTYEEIAKAILNLPGEELEVVLFVRRPAVTYWLEEVLKGSRHFGVWEALPAAYGSWRLVRDVVVRKRKRESQDKKKRERQEARTIGQKGE